jgi:2-haloacid dehalogenase
MSVTRRQFVELAAAGLTAAAPGRPVAGAVATRRLKAVVFDAFPIFNPSTVATRAEALFPGRGPALIEEWRVRQFEYAWLRALSRQYADFWRVTRDALSFAVRRLRLELDRDGRDRLMSAFLELAPWPEVAPALDSLAARGLSLAFLSNLTPRMLEANLDRSGLGSRFTRVLSTDQASTYKPDPGAYELGAGAFGVSREEVLFVAHAGWDAAGAKSFGYPTFWVNRAGLPPEELGVVPDGVGRDLGDLVRFVDARESGGAADRGQKPVGAREGERSW